MGFLSKTSKAETGFESFYGTNIAGSQVATEEMNEEEVCPVIPALLRSWSKFDPPLSNPRCLHRTRIVTSRTNVSFCYFESVNTFCADSGDYLVLMDGTPALNLASFVTTYMWGWCSPSSIRPLFLTSSPKGRMKLRNCKFFALPTRCLI
jgi:hypothetical protein